MVNYVNKKREGIKNTEDIKTNLWNILKVKHRKPHDEYVKKFFALF